MKERRRNMAHNKRTMASAASAVQNTLASLSVGELCVESGLKSLALHW